MKAATIAALLPMTAHDNNFAEKPEYILLLIRLELMDENIDKFDSVVKSVFRMSLERQYSGFVVVDGFLIEQRSIRAMYKSFVELFLLIHSVIALTILLSSLVYPHNLIS